MRCSYLYPFLSLQNFLRVCVLELSLAALFLVMFSHISVSYFAGSLIYTYRTELYLPHPSYSVVFIFHCGVAAEVRVREALRQTRSSAPVPTGRQSTAAGRAIVFSLPETGEHLPWRSEAAYMPVQSQCPPRAQTGQGTSSRVC